MVISTDDKFNIKVKNYIFYEKEKVGFIYLNCRFGTFVVCRVFKQ